MLRTGDQYRNSLRDGREVWIDGKKVEDVPNHPVFKPIVDIRARIYDMAHEAEFGKQLSCHLLALESWANQWAKNQAEGQND